MFKMLTDLYRPFGKSILVVILLTILAELSFVAAPYATGLLIDSIIAQKPILSSLIFLGVALGGQAFFTILFYLKDRYALANLEFTVPRMFQGFSLKKLFSFSIGQHAHENSVFQTSVITRGEAAIGQMLEMSTNQLFPQLINILVMSLAIIVVSPLLGLIFFAGICIYIALSLYDTAKMYPQLKLLEDLRHSHNSRHGEAIRNSRLVIAHAQEDRFIEELRESRANVDRTAEKIWQAASFRYTLREFFIHTIRFVVVAMGIILVAQGKYTPGYLVTFLLWSSYAIASLRPLQWFPRFLMREYASAKKFYETTFIETDVPLAKKPSFPQPFSGKIEFKNVSYSYKPRVENIKEKVDDEEVKKEPAIKNASFTIASGERVAFVGESGAGKSTVISLLLRANDPSEGTILIDNIDLRELDLKEYRRKIGMVEQDVTLFDDTLKRNILFGLGDKMKSISLKELEKISGIARIDRFFSKLEKGFDTVIGERGIRLSGGERQRVGIARALIKEPAILIFDEATSSLDAQNENAIREAINEASKGRTTIIIAHRFSTIKHVDRIFVVENGSIIASGAHEELMKSSKTYQDLVSHQLFSE